MSIFVISIIQARWIIPDYYDDYYNTETERNLVESSTIKFDISTPQEDQDFYPVQTERNLVHPSPIEFDTNTSQEGETMSIYTNGDEYYQDQLISNNVLNFNDTEFDANIQTDKEDNYEREYEADLDFKRLDLHNTSNIGYITLNQVLLKFYFCLFHYIVILIYK